MLIFNNGRTNTMAKKDNYKRLKEVFEDAVAQAGGEGEDKHGGAIPFERQMGFSVTRDVGLGFPLGQAMKKINEAIVYAGEDECGKTVDELLGAINYLAMAAIVLEDM